MAGRLSQKEKPVLGRVSSYKPSVQGIINAHVTDTSKQSKRPLPGAVISAPKPTRTPSHLGRIISNTLPKQIADPIIKAGNVTREFVNPSLSTQLKNAYEEDPTRTMYEITKRSQELDRQGWTIRDKEGTPTTIGVDALAGSMRRVTTKILAKIAKTKKSDEIATLVKDAIPNLTDKQRSILGEVLKDVNDPTKVETILERAVFASQKTDVPKGRVSVTKTPELKQESFELPTKTTTNPPSIGTDLVEEAKKYKTAEEFADSFISPVSERVNGDSVERVFHHLDDGTEFENGLFVKKGDKIFPTENATPEILQRNHVNLNTDGSVKEDFSFSKATVLDGIDVRKELADIYKKTNPPKKTGADLQKEFGSKKISDDFKKTELEAFEQVAKDTPEKLADDFIKKNGNIVSTDRAKSLFPKYVADRTLSDAFQKPARVVSDVAYEKLLKTQKGKGVVRILGGGTGSGKSVAINKGIEDSAVIYEANLPSPASAIERVDKALAEGYEVDLMYVYRDPFDAFDAGVLNRDRSVTIDGHIGTHLPIPKTVLELLKHYRNNEMVAIRVIDNSRGKELSTQVDDPVDFFSNKMYNVEYETSLRQQISDSLERAYREKRINEATYTRTKGTGTASSGRSQSQSQGRSGNRIDPETESLELLATQEANSEYALRSSIREEDRIVSNLEAVFADLKGVDVTDLKTKFTQEDLDKAELNYQFAMESLLDDPARALAKYANRNGTLPEVTGTEFITSSKGKGQIKNSRFGREGDDISSQLGFKSSEEAREAYTAYVTRRQRLTEFLDNLREIRRNINLSKQKDAFVGNEKRKLATETAKNLKGLQAIVQAAERAGFRKGIQQGGQKYLELVHRLRERRRKITGIKNALNLTDGEMKKILGDKDPRFMTNGEFERYLDGVHKGAEARHKTNQERLLVETIIEERDLKKVENLQKALQLPRIENMSQTQLEHFGRILSQTEHGDTFLGPRMIQTAVNTDLGGIRTIGEGKKKIAEQTGMPFDAEGIEGSKINRYLRDSALVERDPLHKMFITEWAAKEADMLTRKYALQRKLNELANAARKSRTRKLFDILAPQDANAVKYAETLPEFLPKLERSMTPAEIEYGKFLRSFFQKYYDFVQQDAANRWTLQGVKHSRFKDMYFPHMTRGFFERWKEDGFVKAVKILWDKNVAESKIDFNAFGDRGEVLGYEKWLKNNMKREAEKGAYTKNAAKTAISYFHAFESKILLDSMIPKIKLLEFIAGKRFQTPKSINNPEGTEKVHSLLSRNLNEWINNKKGQRIELWYAQGDRIESFVDASSTFVSMIDLGANIAIQIGSGVGSALVSARGAGLPKYARGIQRALTKQGRKIAKENSGIIGVTPWFELASVANDAGDTLRNALFSGFGDLSYRARRQMFLGLLTDQEFQSGIISQKRLGEIKLQIGKWHPLPEFDSVAGSTSALKAFGKYTSWATPIFQSSARDIINLNNELRRLAGTKDFEEFVKSPGFRNTLHTALLGVGAYVLGQIIFRPEEADRDTLLGNMRYVAAREAGTLIQGATVIGVITNARMLGFVQDLKDAVVTLATLEQYKKSGPGYEEGDLKGWNLLLDAVTPKSIQQFLPEEETPIKTIDDVKKELLAEIEAGDISVSAAKDKYIKEVKAIEKKKLEKRFTLSQDEYNKDLLARIEAGDITVAEAKDEYGKFLEEKKKYSPETFESSGDADFIEKIQIAAKALKTDPVTVFQAIFTDEEIRRMDNGEIILHRGKTADPEGQKQFSLDEREERGATKDLILDHTIPLQLGGDNGDGNLKLIPKEEWEVYTPVENFLGRMLQRGEITAKEAQKLISDFKAGTITAEELYSAVD